MYAVYNYAAGASQANVLADLIKILTGETNKANLSAACVQANTSITSSVVAGWAVYDASAGTNIQCIRALNQDASTYKYYLLQVGSTTAISGQLSESWNSSTHVGTNNTGYFASVWASAGGGYFYIYATSKNICIMPWTAGGYQVMTGLMVNEVSRDSIPTGYPCGFLLSANTMQSAAKNGACPRVKNWAATGDTTATANMLISPVQAMSFAAAPLAAQTRTFRDASENLYLEALKLGVSQSDSGSNQGPHLGVGYDIFLTGGGTGNALDEISYGGTTYVLFKQNGTTSTILVPKA